MKLNPQTFAIYRLAKTGLSDSKVYSDDSDKEHSDQTFWSTEKVRRSRIGSIIERKSQLK